MELGYAVPNIVLIKKNEFATYQAFIAPVLSSSHSSPLFFFFGRVESSPHVIESVVSILCPKRTEHPITARH
jgi:hypothetical protein